MCNNKKCPCRKCAWSVCEGINCEEYRAWFLQAWEDINRFAWEVMDRHGKSVTFRYGLPHEHRKMVHSPCDDCFCKQWCKTPCSLRLQWWDTQMAMIRHSLGCEGVEK